MNERSDEMKMASTLLAAAKYHRRKCAEYEDFAKRGRQAVESRSQDRSLTKPENLEVTAQCAASSDSHTKWAEWHRVVWHACENAAHSSSVKAWDAESDKLKKVCKKVKA
jgi:hypothetical protein